MTWTPRISGKAHCWCFGGQIRSCGQHKHRGTMVPGRDNEPRLGRGDDTDGLCSPCQSTSQEWYYNHNGDHALSFSLHCLVLTLNCLKNKRRGQIGRKPSPSASAVKSVQSWHGASSSAANKAEPWTQDKETLVEGSRNTASCPVSLHLPCALCSLFLTAPLSTQFPAGVKAAAGHNLGPTWAWNVWYVGQ